MTTGPAGFQVALSLRADKLSAAMRALADACRAAPQAAQLVDWRDAGGRAHDAADEVPGELTGIGLTFAGDAAFGELAVAAAGGFAVGVQHVLEAPGEDAQRAALAGWVDVCRVLLRRGLLTAARVSRQAGGNCLPYLPLVGSATHLVACSARDIGQSFTDAQAFARAWDAIESHDGMRLCLRGLTAMGNPAFLKHILPGQMAMARSARPGLTRFYRPQFAAGELDFLETGEPTLTGVGYYAGEQVYEFAGHTPPGTELRCIDLLLARNIAAAGRIEGGEPVREVRAVFMDEEQAGRSAGLLQAAGVTVCWENSDGRLIRMPALIAPPAGDRKNR